MICMLLDRPTANQTSDSDGIGKDMRGVQWCSVCLPTMLANVSHVNGVVRLVSVCGCYFRILRDRSFGRTSDLDWGKYISCPTV